MDPEAKQKALDESGLCVFCLRHAAGTECYGRGSHSKPAGQMPECEEEHAESLHEVVVGLDASVNLVAEEEDEGEDAYINLARAEGREEEDSGWWDLDDSWLEMEAEEEDKDRIYYLNALTVKEDMEEEEGEEEDEADATRAVEQEEEEGGSWWTPD